MLICEYDKNYYWNEFIKMGCFKFLKYLKNFIGINKYINAFVYYYNQKVC